LYQKELPKALKSEASGILAWAIRGCLLWQRHGLSLPPSIDMATKGYREESDPILEYLQERYEMGNDAFVESSHLRRDYEEWAIENGEKPLNQRSLADRLRAKGFLNERQGHNRTRGWKGLCRKTSTAMEEFPASAVARTDEDAKIQ
jgi:putative DNA primase/helicase